MALKAGLGLTDECRRSGLVQVWYDVGPEADAGRAGGGHLLHLRHQLHVQEVGRRHSGGRPLGGPAASRGRVAEKTTTTKTTINVTVFDNFKTGMP